MATRSRAGADAEDGRASGRLDLHEGISDPAAPAVPAVAGAERVSDPLEGGCQRWPEHLRLLNLATGELRPGRCRATNLCRYCQTLYVRETVEMLSLDAVEYAPTLWLVLTAREHLTRRQTYRHLEQLSRSLRRTWPDFAYFVQVEFQRRGALHLNLLVKGVPVEQVRAFYEAATALWCSRVDAVAGPFEAMDEGGQWCQPIDDGEGVIRYLQKTLAHGLKAEQAPPLGWKGHRTSQSRNYLVRPASVMRLEARRSIRLARLIHRLDDAELAELELQLQQAETWELRQVLPLSAPEPDPEQQQAGLARDARRVLIRLRRPAAAVPRVGRGAGAGATRPERPAVDFVRPGHEGLTPSGVS